MWECLAEAYILRGSYNSALKAFGKAHEIDETAIYPLFKFVLILS